MKIEIDLSGIENVKNKINLFTHSNVPRIIANTIYSDIKEKFVDEKDVKGHKFAPLRPNTIKEKRRQHKIPYKILRDTGRLLNSLNSSINGKEIKIGYSAPYAIDHEYGATERYLPQRKILPTDESEIPLREIREIITEYFKGL